MQPLTQQEIEFIERETRKRLAEQKNRPLVVSIMGQTGVGKSSLIKALFNLQIDRKINAVVPTTKKIETYTMTGANGQALVFHDMPGIGESEEIDNTYLEEYRHYFLSSDIVLWAIHVDNRSVSFDFQALQFILEGIESDQRKVLMSRITFVLTKADVLTPSPWIMGYLSDYVILTPSKAIRETLREKERYYQDKFIKRLGDQIVAWTYNDIHFNLTDFPSFSFDDFSVYYHGLMTREKVDYLKQRYPQFSQIFERLYDNYRIIPCSALFKYNLTQLLLIILNKLGPDAIESFRKLVDEDTLNHVSFAEAKKLCNVRIFDMQTRRTVFDLREGIFPDINNKGI